MTKKRNVNLIHDDHITSAGRRLGDVPEDVRNEVEWMDGTQGSASNRLPSKADVPVPSVIKRFTKQAVSGHPRGATAMIDFIGAKHRLKRCWWRFEGAREESRKISGFLLASARRSSIGW